MIGKYQVQWDATSFVKGQSLSDYSPDGGFGSSSFGINPLITPGIIYGTPGLSSVATAPTAELIASCEDFNDNTYYRLFVDSAASFYYYDGANLTKDRTGSGHTYANGRADIVYTAIGGAECAFVSSNDNISKWIPGVSLAETWWTATASGTALGSTVPHPLLVFGSTMLIGDGNLVHGWNGVAQNSILTLQANEQIFSMGIEPGSGLVMLGTQTKSLTSNIGNVQSAQYYVLLWDGFSSTIRRRVPVDDLPTSFYNLAGQVVVGYGQNVGIWNGNGFTFLRRLTSNPTTRQTLLYKHHITNIGRVLYYVDGTDIMAYGQIVPGQNAVWRLFSNVGIGSTDTISMLCNAGSNNLGVSFNTSGSPSFNTLATMTAGNSAAILYMNNVNFPRPIFVRRLRIVTTAVTTTGAIPGSVYILNEKGTATQTANVGFSVSAAESPKYVFDYDFTSLKVVTAQPKINFDTKIFAIVRVILYYDMAE